MASSWTPKDIRQLMVVVTGCLCLPVLIMGTMYLIDKGTLSSAALDPMTSAGTGGGIIGLGWIIYHVIKAGLGEKK